MSHEELSIDACMPACIRTYTHTYTMLFVNGRALIGDGVGGMVTHCCLYLYSLSAGWLASDGRSEGGSEGGLE